MYIAEHKLIPQCLQYHLALHSNKDHMDFFTWNFPGIQNWLQGIHKLPPLTQGHSINDNIPKPICSLSYIPVDDAINVIMRSGLHTLLAMVDIKSAFKLIPVHPTETEISWLCNGTTKFTLMVSYLLTYIPTQAL